MAEQDELALSGLWPFGCHWICLGPTDACQFSEAWSVDPDLKPVCWECGERMVLD